MLLHNMYLMFWQQQQSFNLQFIHWKQHPSAEKPTYSSLFLSVAHLWIRSARRSAWAGSRTFSPPAACGPAPGPSWLWPTGPETGPTEPRKWCRRFWAAERTENIPPPPPHSSWQCPETSAHHQGKRQWKMGGWGAVEEWGEPIVLQRSGLGGVRLGPVRGSAVCACLLRNEDGSATLTDWRRDQGGGSGRARVREMTSSANLLQQMKCNAARFTFFYFFIIIIFNYHRLPMFPHYATRCGLNTMLMLTMTRRICFLQQQCCTAFLFL